MTTEAHTRALRRFCAAMRRHERRARRLGRPSLAAHLRKVRLGDDAALGLQCEGTDRRRWMLPGRFGRGWSVSSENTKIRREAFLYERAAEAVAKLQAARIAADAAARRPS